MPYLIVATSCRSCFCFFFHFSLLRWAIMASTWVKCFLLLIHASPVFHALNAPTPLPCLHFPVSHSQYPLCTLRSWYPHLFSPHSCI
jgi:hypothetical protein